MVSRMYPWIWTPTHLLAQILCDDYPDHSRHKILDRIDGHDRMVFVCECGDMLNVSHARALAAVRWRFGPRTD